MELIDRYLDAVRLLLPISQRADIVSELRDELLSRREEREAGLGRALTPQENEALLREFGHPVLVAGRYGARQYLIGPEVFAVYAFVLKIVLACVWGGALISGLVMAAAESHSLAHALLTTFNIAWTGGFAAVGTVTVIFAVLERTPARQRLFADWRPRDLPRIGRRHRGDSWQEHVAGIVVLTLFVLWWIGLLPLWRPILPLKAGEVLVLAPAPVWQTVYWPILVLAGGLIGLHVMKLARRGRPLTLAADIALQAALVALAAWVLRAGHWAMTSGVGLSQAALAQVDYGVNVGAKVTLIVVICVGIATIGLDLWRLARPEEGGGAAIRG
jgi:hypothetical protein